MSGTGRSHSGARAAAAAQRRQVREARMQLRELQRRAKEEAKLSELEHARLEVDTYENRVALLLSIHREQGEHQDWEALAAALAPDPPQRLSTHEFRARQQAALHARPGSGQRPDENTAIEQARLRDEQEFRNTIELQADAKAEWKRIKELAFRILAGEPFAYLEALAEFNPLEELAEIGSRTHFTVHGAGVLECALTVDGQKVVPSEAKTLTATGKASVRPMPKGRFQELYEAYVSGCLWRVARELFAFLPVDTVLVNVSADVVNPRTGQTATQALLSAAVSRSSAARIDFDRVDPAAAIETFPHRSAFATSARSGAYLSINPLTPADLGPVSAQSIEVADVIANFKRLREDLSKRIDTLRKAQTDRDPNKYPST